MGDSNSWMVYSMEHHKKKKENMHDSGVPLFQHERIGVFWVDGFEGLGNGCFVS